MVVGETFFDDSESENEAKANAFIFRRTTVSVERDEKGKIIERENQQTESR